MKAKGKKNRPTASSSHRTEGDLKIRNITYLINKLPFAYGIFFLSSIGVLLWVFERELLFRMQELNLFLPTTLFLKAQWVYPGGFLSWLGAFFTQFFFYPAWGIFLLLILWAWVMLAIKKAFQVPPRHAIVLVVPVAILLATLVQNGYWIFYQKQPGYSFSSTLGFLFSMLSVWILRRLPEKKGLHPFWISGWIILGYPLLGVYSFIGTLYLVLTEWQLPCYKLWGKIALSVWSVLLTIAVPLFASHFYVQTGIAQMFAAGLPNFSIEGKQCSTYYYPYIALVCSPLLAFFTAKQERSTLGLTPFICIQLSICLLTGYVIKQYWFRNDNFNRELYMNRAIENLDWEEVLSIARQAETTPTRLMVMNKNLALFRLGRAGDEMFHYPEGGTEPAAPFTVRMAQTGGKMLYYHYGKQNFCYRWCMEDGVEYGWKVEYLKFMVKNSLLNGDHKVARKYINLLKKTWFHRDWALKYETYLNQPEQIKTNKEFKPILQLMTYKDQLDGDNTLVELYLLNSFANGYGEDPLYQEQTLIAALLVKDINLFWPRFTKYATMHPDLKHMPTHYQEAAYLYGHLENKVDISGMPFDKDVIARYKQFMAFTQQNQHLTEEQLKRACYPLFGNTFYYFYFFIRNVKTY